MRHKVAYRVMRSEKVTVIESVPLDKWTETIVTILKTDDTSVVIAS